MYSRAMRMASVHRPASLYALAMDVGSLALMYRASASSYLQSRQRQLTAVRAATESMCRASPQRPVRALISTPRPTGR